MSDEFENADFYTCRDGDELRHETIGDAIEEALDDCADPPKRVNGELVEQPLAEIAEKLAPLTVTAYARKIIPDEWFQGKAEWLAEQMAETFDDEYGNPGGHEQIDKAAIETFAKAVGPLIRAMTGPTGHWCEEISERVYSAAEIIELAGKNHE